MKALIFSALLCFAVSGCSVFDKIGVYIDENPVLVNIATSQVVTRYIEEGDTIEAKRHRAEGVQRRVSKVLAFIDGNPKTTVDGLLLVIDKSIDWSGLSYPDKVLVSDIVSLIEAELRKYETSGQDFNTKTTFALKAIFTVAIRAAEIYLK